MEAEEPKAEGEEEDHGTLVHPNQSNGVQQHVSPSLPVPVDAQTGYEEQVDSSGGLIPVIPSTLPREEEVGAVPHQIVPPTVEIDIPEEKATCRICLVELGEGDTFKLKCSCKGELALTHRDCMKKWFTIKGNRKCEVCKAEVRNIRITSPNRVAEHVPLPTVEGHDQSLLPTAGGHDQSPLPTAGGHAQTTNGHAGQRVVRLGDLCLFQQCGPSCVHVAWFNMLSYFGFMVLYLSLHDFDPIFNMAFSFTYAWLIGLLALTTTTPTVGRRFPWIHALVQFMLVVLFAQMFHSLLYFKALISVFLGIATGFFAAYCMSCAVTVLLKLLEHRRNSQEIQLQIQTTTV